MGADFCFALVPKCELTPERLAKAKAIVEQYGHQKVSVTPFDHEDLCKVLDRLAAGGYETRDTALLQLRGADYLVTGGMSWGDPPTEAYQDFNALDFPELFNHLEQWSLEDNR